LLIQLKYLLRRKILSLENRAVWKEFNDDIQRRVEAVVNDYSSRQTFDSSTVAGPLISSFSEGLPLFTSLSASSRYSIVWNDEVYLIFCSLEILSGAYGLLFTSRVILSHYEDLFLKERGIGNEADDYRRKLQYSMVHQTNISDIILDTAEDARMFCVEKNGLPAKINVFHSLFFFIFRKNKDYS
jgi:hypothetical protein